MNYRIKASSGATELRVYPEGYREWRRDGRLHREDGPAVEQPDGSREWWLCGRRFMTKEKWRSALAAAKGSGTKDVT